MAGNANCPLLEYHGVDSSQPSYEGLLPIDVRNAQKRVRRKCPARKCLYDFNTACLGRRDIVIELCEYLYQKEVSSV